MTDSVRLALAGGTIFMAAGVGLAFNPAFLVARGVDPVAIGALFAALSATRLLAGPAAGHLADRWGDRRLALIVSAAATVAVMAIYPFPIAAWALALAFVAQAAMSAPLMPLAEALTARAGADGRIDYGRVRGAQSGAFVLGTLVAGVVVDAAGILAMAWLLPAAYLLIFMAMPALPADPAGRAPRGGAGALWRNPRFRLLLATTGLIHGSHAAYYVYGTLHWRGAGLSGTAIALLWSWGVTAEIILFLLARRVSATPARLAMLAAAAAALRWCVIAATTDFFLLLLAQTLHAATFGFTHLAAVRWVLAHTPPERAGAAQGMLATWGGGAWIGAFALLCGPLYAALGAGMWWFMAAACLAAVPLARRLGR